VSAIRALGDRPVPPGRPGSFDHGDVHPTSGRVFVTHTSEGTIDVLEPFPGGHAVALPGCREGSGLVCTPDGARVFAASRADGRVLEIVPTPAPQVARAFAVGPRPNGLAWDPDERRLLVADVGDNGARLFGTDGDEPVARESLPGRPRWCLYDPVERSFLVNVREPAAVLSLDARTLATRRTYRVRAQGPHGLALDETRRRAYVATDDANLIALALDSGREEARVRLSGPPDVVWLDPARRRVYVSVGEPGRVDVIDADSPQRVERLETETGAHTSALDVRRGLLYAFLPETCAARAFDVDGG
jgi:DNA-binding beta-propeller fold protein YncE